MTRKDAINKIDEILLQLETNSKRIEVITFINDGYDLDGGIVLRRKDYRKITERSNIDPISG